MKAGSSMRSTITKPQGIVSFVAVWGDSKSYRRSHESGHYE